MRFVETRSDSADARRMLTEYFRSRELGFTGGVYRVSTPDPDVFVPPRGAFLLVVDDEDTVVGCGGIRRLEDTEEGLRFEVKHLWLRPEVRGRGWGRALLRQLEQRARELGAATLVLDTNASLAEAGRLYRASGFEAVAPYNDNPNANVWLRKNLSGAAASVSDQLEPDPR